LLGASRAAHRPEARAAATGDDNGMEGVLVHNEIEYFTLSC
jgi:hypothetical protein